MQKPADLPACADDNRDYAHAFQTRGSTRADARNDMAELTTIYGAMSVPDVPGDLIIHSLRLHGEWAMLEPLLLAPMLRAGDRIWDVGAFLGTFGLGLAQQANAKPGSLLSVEPNPDNLPHLRRNLERNAPCPARIADCIVGKDGMILQRRDGTGEGNAGAIAYEPTAADSGLASRSLASLRAEFGDYDVLKLDIEGMENTAIRGDIEYLRSGRAVIWAECNETSESILLLEALVWLGYEPLYVAFPAFRKANYNRSDEQIYPLAYEAALLAAPPDRLSDFTGRVEGEEIIVRPVKTSYDLRKALFATPRWAMAEWVNLSRPELIALLGRAHRNQTMPGFLNV